MYKKILFLALFPFLLSGFVQPLFAQENVVFGPALYERSTGKPITEKIAFTSPTSGADFMMKIHNGDDQGNHRVSSGAVTLNGIQIAGSSDFNQSVEWIERTVSINTTNEISVNLASPPGSFITITIVGAGSGPSVSISASSETIQTGESSTLSWSSSNAETATIDQGIGDIPVNGSITVSPSQTTTYTITATGPGGTATDSVTVTVIYPAPTVSISASPDTIQPGGSTTLSWTSSNADSAEINNGIGSVPVNGSLTVSPAETTTYTITVTGPGGTATASVTVTVTYPAPSVSISAAPDTIQSGGSATLSWTSSNADSATIDNGIGSVPVDGSITVSPAETTTYTITVNGPGGTATAGVTVTTVIHLPLTVNISANPETIQIGESAVLTWSSTNANSCVIEPNIGNVGINGSITVSPTETTTYTITATGPEGTATASAGVNVNHPPIAKPQSITTGEGTPVSITLTATDVDEDTLTYRIVNSPDHGSLTGTPPDLTYTPSNDYYGSDLFTFKANDGTADSNIATISLTINPVDGVVMDTDYGFSPDNQQGGSGVVGESICILNGNSVESRLDLQFSSPNRLGLSFQAAYNSQSDTSGSSGFGWTHTYSVVLNPAYEMSGQTYLKITDETGRAAYFTEASPGIYQGEFNERSRVEIVAGEYVWYRPGGSRYGFSATGRLLWIDDETGNRLALEYDASDQLETVTDTASGRVLTFDYSVDGLLVSVSGPATDAVPDGVWVVYGYDADQNLVSVTYPDGSGFDYIYADPDDVHNLTEKRDKSGHLLNTWAYGAQDKATGNFSMQGKGVSIRYVGETQVEVTDAYGTVRTYTIGEINGRKRVTAMQGIAGAPYSENNTVRWEYDGQMNLIEVETAGGTIHQYRNYDVRGNPGTIILASGASEERVITYTYHPDMDTLLTWTESSVLGGGNKETVWDYDDDYDAAANENPTGLLSRVVEKGLTRDISGAVVPYAYVTTFTYNSKGQVLSIDGPLPGNGDTTSFTYDQATGDLLSITRPLVGSGSLSNYDAAGQTGLATDVNNRSEHFTYDERGRVTAVSHQADASTAGVTYNIAGLLDSRTDEDGVAVSFEYDVNYGRLSRRIDYENNYISYGYDAQGNVIEKGYYDASGTRTNRKRYLYQDPAHDMPGKLYREINPDATFTQYGYDSEANIASMIDPKGRTIYYDYDLLNRPITVTQPGSAVTSYGYDIHGNLDSVTDAESRTTAYEYDDMGRVVSAASPDTGAVLYAYDETGNLISKTDAKGITTGYAYDLLNRLTHVGFPDPAQDITYAYDQGLNGNGRFTGMIDQSGSTTFSYDDRGRLTEKTATVYGFAYPLVRSFTPGSRLSSVTLPTGRAVNYERSACACKIDTVSTTLNGSTATLLSNLSYRPFGIAKGMDAGSGGMVENVFDESGRMTVANPGAPREQTYTYDANSSITSIHATNQPWLNQDFGYDDLNRLSTATGPYGSISYNYDKTGNRTLRQINVLPQQFDYTPGTSKIYVMVDTAYHYYTYDANGNTTGMGNKTLVYNQNNRMIRVDEGGVTVGQYAYNGLGQRVTKETGGETTVFHYDFDGHLIGESLSTGIFTAEYLYKGDNLLAKVDSVNNNLYYYQNNYLGTPQMLVDSTNTIVWEATYLPFGQAYVNPGSSVVNNVRFPGQYYDEETGLHYNYHRYYDPSTGRYLTPDPIGLLGGLNLYPYAHNDPINSIDPEGLLKFNAEYRSGLAGYLNFRFGVFKGKVNINAGTQHYPISGPNYVSEGVVVKVESQKYGLGIGAVRKAPGEAHGLMYDRYGRPIPGSGNSVHDILGNTPWKRVGPVINSPWGDFEWAKFKLGFQVLIGAEIEIDFSEEAKFWWELFSGKESDCE